MKMFRFGPVRSVNPISLVSSPSLPLGSPARSMVFVAALLTTVLLGTSTAHAAEVEYSATPLHAKPWTPCPPATTTKAECEVIVAPRPSAEAGIPEYEGSGELGGLDPEDLRSAYKLPEKGGSGTTIAIVDAYNDPNAQSDLNVYRKHYGLPECTEGNGCFKKVNASGETKNYPSNEWGWSIEISLDLDMVSAACQECHILLVEASSEGISALGAAEEEAVKLGASAISNSWNIGFEGSEAGEIHSTEETTDNKYFNHPGIPILFSGGDYGYAVRYPAVSQYVVAVGGTTLKKAEGTRGWTDEVWSNPAYGVRQKGRGTGSGCSKYETKPKWQADTVCSKRIETDVAADADWEKSPVSLYDSYELPGWETNGGTSASAPFVAGVEGLSTSHAREIGAEAFYKAGAAGKLFDVTKGSNGTCTPPSEDEYWCTAKTGYDGPTGMGTPDGVIEANEPSATTKAATSVTETGATLNGTVNPNGFETKYYFEYGKTTSYGTKTAETSAGSGTSTLEESKAITGLTLSTTYHFRIVATNSKGTTDGEDKTFKTAESEIPKNTALPVASPTTPDQAVPETTTTGTWTHSPTGYKYQWERCNSSGGECEAISGATTSTYTPVEKDVEHTLVAKVTAENSHGAGEPAFSKATNKVKPVGQFSEYGFSGITGTGGLAAGPDGNMWFTTWSSATHEEYNIVGKITPSGTVTEYSLPAESEPGEITAGPDGNMWVAERKSKQIAKITTAGSITQYSVSFEPREIVAGPESDLWFAGPLYSGIGKITTAGTVTVYKLPGYPAGEADEITAGPDGNVWFTNISANTVGKMTPSGTVTEYSLPTKASEPWGITAGPDGNLWFAEENTNKIGKITTSGTITEYALPAESNPYYITTGPDGNLWFGEASSHKIGRITTSGTITEYSVPGALYPNHITSGPGKEGDLWFGRNVSSIGIITA